MPDRRAREMNRLHQGTRWTRSDEALEFNWSFNVCYFSIIKQNNTRSRHIKVKSRHSKRNRSLFLFKTIPLYFLSSWFIAWGPYILLWRHRAVKMAFRYTSHQKSRVINHYLRHKSSSIINTGRLERCRKEIYLSNSNEQITMYGFEMPERAMFRVITFGSWKSWSENLMITLVTKSTSSWPYGFTNFFTTEVSMCDCKVFPPFLQRSQLPF